MREALRALWSFLIVLCGAAEKAALSLDALAEIGLESAREIRDEERISRAARLQQLEKRAKKGLPDPTP